MKFEEYKEKLKQVDELIRHANTGTPNELAKRLHVSERTVRRLIERLRIKNKSIRFCRKAKSYVIEN